MLRSFISSLIPIVVALAPIAGCIGSEPSEADPTQAIDLTAASPRTAMVHLFEWRWNDVAEECERFLGPKGFAGVQVSPPNEHASIAGHPWYQRYQPVSYKLESRSGTRAEFASMVRRCKAVGVDIYVDAVINHMAGGDGVGSAGTRYTHYDYPGTYQVQDFHHCDRPDSDIRDYSSRYEVQTCELVNLADLDTGAPHVQEKIADYLNDLVGLGVAGFRIDATKHIAADDLRAILGRVRGNPYVYQEVIDQGGEAIGAGEYFGIGDVTEFRYGLEIGRVFSEGKLAWLSEFGPAWGFMPSEKAIVFTDNHDNQRGHGGGGKVVSHKNGTLYDLANVFVLAYPYGYPQIMSSYRFDNTDQGPPADEEGRTRAVYRGDEPDCFGSSWVCEHRFRPVANMVGFRNATAGSFFTSNFWTNGDNQIAFGRGDKGFVAINRQQDPLVRRFETSMPEGTYFDVISGELSPDGASCSGKTVRVDADRGVDLDVPTFGAIAFHAKSRLK